MLLGPDLQIVPVEQVAPPPVIAVLLLNRRTGLRGQARVGAGVLAHGATKHLHRSGLLLPDLVVPALDGGQANGPRLAGDRVLVGLLGQLGELGLQCARIGRVAQQRPDDRKAEGSPAIGRPIDRIVIAHLVCSSPATQSAGAAYQGAGYHRGKPRSEGKFCASYKAIAVPDPDGLEEVEREERNLSVDANCCAGLPMKLWTKPAGRSVDGTGLRN